jgi:hypothetical protein
VTRAPAESLKHHHLQGPREEIAVCRLFHSSLFYA